MFESNDSTMAGRGILLLVLLLAALAFAGVGYWRLRPARPQQAAPAPAAAGPAADAGRTNGTLSITLCVPSDNGLESMHTSIPKQYEVQLEARAAINAVLAGERSAPSLLGEFSLRGVYLDEGGAAYVDLAPRGRQEARASARDELLALYAMVNTLIMNFPEVRQVRFLVDGKEAQTLAGHIDLTRAYGKRMDLMRS